MCVEFTRISLGSGDLRPRNGKRLRWNVDHLLDQHTVELIGVYVIRSALRLEGDVAKLLELDPATVVFERGLGANDIPGNTHLLRVEASEEWWRHLPGRLRQLIERPSWTTGRGRS
jgi:Uri superfamily endonuclease